jgi:hypothetical protein
VPWASEAQRRKFYATPSLHKFIPEFNAATPKGRKLPDHVKKRGHMAGNFIQGAIKHPGALHKQLHVPQGKKIPPKRLKAAAHGDSTEARRARLAMTLAKLRERRGGS